MTNPVRNRSCAPFAGGAGRRRDRLRASPPGTDPVALDGVKGGWRGPVGFDEVAHGLAVGWLEICAAVFSEVDASPAGHEVINGGLEIPVERSQLLVTAPQLSQFAVFLVHQETPRRASERARSTSAGSTHSPTASRARARGPRRSARPSPRGGSRTLRVACRLSARDAPGGVDRRRETESLRRRSRRSAAV